MEMEMYHMIKEFEITWKNMVIYINGTTHLENQVRRWDSYLQWQWNPNCVNRWGHAGTSAFSLFSVTFNKLTLKISTELNCNVVFFLATALLNF